MAPPDLSSVYRLVVRAAAGTNGLGTDEAPRFEVVLHLDANGQTWSADASEHAPPLTLPPALIRRCGHLARWPEHNLPDGSRALTDPDPNKVTTRIDQASIEDIAAWLFEQLPRAVQAELTRGFANPVRLLVDAEDVASVLPWHRLCWFDEQANGIRRPMASGTWSVWLHVPDSSDGTQPPPSDHTTPLQPRVLLLVGSQRQRPEADAAEYDVLATVQAIHAAGFRCDVAAGGPVRAGLDGKLGRWIRLDQPEHACRLIATGDYDIVHFVGHSDASRRTSAGQAPTDSNRALLGASALLFEFPGDATPRPLPITALRSALRGVAVRLVVLHACLAHERVAYTLLGPGDDGPGVVDAVLGMAAMAMPAVCASFAQAFYRSWHEQHELSVAVHTATRAIRDSHPGYDWLPVHWSRHGHSLRLADARDRRLHDYCRGLLLTHRAFEGVFDDEHQPDVLQHVAVDLELSRERSAGEQQRRLCILQRLPKNERLLFADLLDAGGWWTLGGAPGAGKTTTLRLATRRLAADRRRTTVPIYLPLSSWLQAITKPADRWASPDGAELRDDRATLAGWLFGHIAERAQLPELAADLEAVADHGSLVLLFDGLDELSPPLRTLFVRELLPRMRERLERHSLVVATRRYESARRLPLDWFGDADVCELRHRDALGLLAKLLAGVPQAELDEHVRWFSRQLEDGVPLWSDLARTPLLVSLLGKQMRAGKQPATSRLQFFGQAFSVLCRGRHRQQPTPLAHERDAMQVLRYLAYRLTRSQSRTATLAQFVGWLEGGDSDPSLQPSEKASQALGNDPKKWMPVVPAHELDEPTVAEAFLRRIAEHTLILGPEDTSPNTAWRFWHRSFQEALCAEWLHEQFVLAQLRESHAQEKPSREELERLELQREQAGIDAFLTALAGWGVGTAPGPDTVARHCVELKAAFKLAGTSQNHYTESQRELLFEGTTAPTVDPIERHRRLSSLRGIDFVAACLEYAAEARARRESSEALLESLALWTDRLGPLDTLLLGLTTLDWWLGLEVALRARTVPPGLLDSMLLALPELGHRQALVDRAVERLEDSAVNPLLEALAARGTLLGRILADAPADTAIDNPHQLRRVWDSPGELFVLYRAATRIERRGGRSVEAQTTATRIIGCLPKPDLRELERALFLVPGREDERELGRELPGFRLWRLIAAGSFRMGTANGGPIGNEVLHSRTIAQPFWIAAVPVTTGLYRLFSPQHAVRTKAGYSPVGDRSLDASTAVGGVSHHAARMFCIWLTHHAGNLLGRLVGTSGKVVARLPREAEWEYAARAGTETTFFFGNKEIDLSHYGWNSDPNGAPQPVAKLRGVPELLPDAPAAGANRFGLFDVHGNVWEWCSDWYQPDASKPAISCGRFRVRRGGSYWYVAAFCRSAYRSWYEPAWNNDGFGFRLVVSAQEPDL